MKKKVFVVTGATGNIGEVLAETLLEHGHDVRVIGRSEDRLRPLVDKGAEPFVGTLEDAAYLNRAFTGADAIFAMIPPNYGAIDFRAYQNKIAEALVTAVRASGVSKVVTLSSISAHLAEGTGPIKGLHDLEERFNQLEGADVVHLRPAFFMENLLFGVDTIKNMGINGSALRPDLAMPMIATKDIAAAAAEQMEQAEFKGKTVRELLGNKDITMEAATSVLGEAIGKPELKYVRFPYEDVRTAMLGLGMSASVVDEMIEMYQGMNDGRVKPKEARSPQNTTPTTLKEFSEAFAEVYGSSMAAGSAG